MQNTGGENLLSLQILFDMMSIEPYVDQSRLLFIHDRLLNDDSTWSISVRHCMKPVGLKWFN